MATWPAAMDIGDSRLITGEPLTTELFGDYCDRDDELQDCCNPETLVRICGRSYSDALGNWVKNFPDAVRTVNAAGDHDIMQQLHLCIPEGCVRLTGKIAIAVTNYAAGACHVALKIGGVKGTTVTLTAAAVTVYDITYTAPPAGTFDELIVTVWRTDALAHDFTVQDLGVWSEMI